VLRIKELFLPLCAVLCAEACDPGRHYSIPGAKAVRADGVRYVAAIGDGIEARFYANIFTIHGWTEVQVLNNSVDPIEFQPTPTLIVGGDASEVPARCALPSEKKLAIERGQMMTVRCEFEARLRRLSSYEPAFDTLTLVQPGFSRGGKALVVVASMRGS